ncbi:MAG: hypothetical protein ACRD0O_19270 [Acidimicrobiia bacterium]
MGSIPATSAPAPNPQGESSVKKLMLLVIVLALGAVVAKKKLAA